MYQKDPTQIEASSMEIIESNMTPHQYCLEELAVVKRMIHSSGDYEYQHIVSISSSAIKMGLQALQPGCRIVTDTKMAMAGINKRTLKKLGCSIENYIDHPDVYQMAKEQGTTRSMAAVNFSIQSKVDIFVIGNAPTALFKIGELIQEKKIHPSLVIGIPVGFVGAAESKAFIRTIDIPSISTIGNKGGSNIAAAVMNALIYLKSGRIQ